MSDNSLEVVDNTQEANPVEAEKETVESVEEAQAETTNEAEDATEISEADKVRQAMQKRIDRMTAAKKAEEERYKSELEELKKRVEQVKPQSDDAEPKMEDFESLEDYEQAKAKHLADKMFNERLKAEETRKQQEAQRQEFEVKQRELAGRIEEFKSSTPDYETVAEGFRELSNDLTAIKGQGNPTLEAIGQTIFESEVAPQLIYEIGKNPEIGLKMADMSPTQAIKEIAKLELTLSKPKAKEVPPKPVNKVEGNAKSASTPDAIADRMLKGMGY